VSADVRTHYGRRTQTFPEGHLRIGLEGEAVKLDEGETSLAEQLRPV
jgi:hypothetical protein